MPDAQYFPQLPSTVWWGVRELLSVKPTATFTDTLLATHLGVQQTAAKAYLKELRTLGILTDEGKATDVALKWRTDPAYSEAVSEIVSQAYPEELLTISPPENPDRSKAKQWFVMSGLGTGSAGNKAATYILVSSPTPGGATEKTTMTNEKFKPKVKAKTNSEKIKSDDSKTVTQNSNDNSSSKSEKITPPNVPLNVNVQIHISADASADQIDAIFKSMRTHLYNDTL